VIGFDSISVSSFANRMLGREAHKAFLNPEKPILLLEDMDLREVNKNTNFKEIIVAPMRIAKCDGLPCTIFAKIKEQKKFSILNSQFSTILWDFDGVILNSMKIKGDGFVELFNKFDETSLKKIEKFHYENGGVSRFDKIRYFYNTILKKEISEDEVLILADKFATIIENRLFDKNNLIMDSVRFIENNHKKYHFHIVSGAEHNELNRICKHFNLSQYFITIEGSPTKKDVLVKNILEKYGYEKNETVLIGDAMTDYTTAMKNGIGFYGYNNQALKQFDYIERFEDFSYE